MPFCAEATLEVYDFFAAKGCKISPDSPRDKWLVTLGIHKPWLTAEKWLAVQAKFGQNKFDKTMKYDVPLLKGILRCSCGSIMCPGNEK